MKWLLKLTFGLAIIAVHANVAKADDAEAIAAVRCTELAFSLSVENKDRNAFSMLIDNDARFIGNSVLRGRDDIVEAWSVFFSVDGPELVWQPQFIEVLGSGDLAFSRGTYRSRSRDENGVLLEEWGTFNSVWRRNGAGKWHIIFDAGDVSPISLEAQFAGLIEDNKNECD